MPVRVIGQAPLEISAGKELSFIKAGYFPTRILDPSMHDSVDLYPFKYYLDYAYHKNIAQEEDWGAPHYYMDNKPEAFTEYKKELIRMTCDAGEAKFCVEPIVSLAVSHWVEPNKAERNPKNR